jgi:hypothetical protein
MSRRANRNKKDEQDFGSVWSLGFFLATIANIMLCPVVILLILVSPQRTFLYDEAIMAYGFGLISATLIVGSSKIHKLRTIIHEIKHAVMVLLTGNKLKSIVANKHDGYVEYKMYTNRLHFAPLIKLAPYFFPLFSLPMFGVAILFDSYYLVLCSLLLGAALAADTAFGVEEIHPFQTDFKKLLGGFFLSKIYIVGFYLLWFSCVTLWVRSGPDGIWRGFSFLGELILLKIQ